MSNASDGQADSAEGEQPDRSAAESQPLSGDQVSLDKIEELLKATDDTSRFVGLALLKPVLDNSAGLRDDQDSISQLWDCISPKFLDRLLRTGSGPRAPKKDSKDMLDLAVAVIHTFTLLLPDGKRGDPRLVDRIPLLVASILHRYAGPAGGDRQTRLTRQKLRRHHGARPPGTGDSSQPCRGGSSLQSD